MNEQKRKIRVTALLWLANYIHYEFNYLADRHIDLQKIRVQEIEELYLEFNSDDTTGNKQYQAILTHLPYDITMALRTLSEKCKPVEELLEKTVYLTAGTVLVPKPEYLEQMRSIFRITEYVVTEEQERQNATLGERWMLKDLN